MKNIIKTNIFSSLLLAVIVVVLGAVLLNLPRLYFEQELPIYPALLLAQACLVGLGLTLFVFHKNLISPVLQARRLRQTKNKADRQPWAYNRQWVRKKVVQLRLGLAVLKFIFLANWLGAIIFFYTQRGDEIINGPVPVLVFSIVIILAWLLMLFSMLKNILHWLRFGDACLLIETLPGKPGGLFEGVVKPGLGEKPRQSVQISLVAYQRIWHTELDIDDGYHKRGDVAASDDLYRDTTKLAPSKLHVSGGELQIPIKFSIPDDAPTSGLDGASREVVWKIEVEFKGKKDPAFNAEFEIPVF